MIDLTGVTHHPAIEEIVEVLCNKTQNTDKGFFRAEVAYFLAKAASNMRAKIITKDRGEFPVNLYVLALATSGFGKGHSVHIVENEFFQGYKRRFLEETFPTIADKNLWEIANDRAAKNGTDPQDEYDKIDKEFRQAGALAYTFDSGTSPAVKQLRHKLLLANCGSVNLQIDEIGSNLVGNTDILNLFLELYDQGIVKQKLTKNTSENQRADEIDGKTPTNMLLFGTPNKLLDGSQTEDHFYSFLETGYARRCIFGWGQLDRKAFNTQTPAEIYKRLTEPSNATTIAKWANHFYELANPALYDRKIQVNDDVAIKLLEYKIACEKVADALPEHEEIRKAELSHRFFKALKLAGALAFIDMSVEVEMNQLLQAILLVEESGTSFQTILNREKTYIKLAKYIASVDTELTHADLHEALPFYKSSNSARNEMMTLAIAWAYKQHIIIKKTFTDGIEFFQGQTLKETDLDNIKISYSDHWAYNYANEYAPFEQLHVLTQSNGYHWCNHHFKNNHRLEENAIVGFNIIVLDIDGDTTLDTAHELLKEIKFMTYTTKRHTDEENRFRLIIPINYYLELDSEEYHEFIDSVLTWLPFKCDEQANQRARKWETFHDGSYHYNMDGETLDALKFIPKTTKNEQYKQAFQKIESMDNLERWFAQRIATGNRNNQMIRFAFALMDTGMDLVDVRNAVINFNNKLNNSLDEKEIESTIMVSVAKRYQTI